MTIQNSTTLKPSTAHSTIAHASTGVYKNYYLGLVKSSDGVDIGMGCYDDKGQFIVLINNRNATNPTYLELVDFLQKDKTEQFPYIYKSEIKYSIGTAESNVDVKRIYDIIDGLAIPTNPYKCGDFAERLHNNAELAGIRCGYVDVELSGYVDRNNLGIPSNSGHALVIFQTTDRGLIYVDDTGNLASDVSEDRVAYLEKGQPYGCIGLEVASTFGFDYSGYNKWLAQRDTRKDLLNKYEVFEVEQAALQKQYDSLHTQYEVLKKQYDLIVGGRATLPSDEYKQAMIIYNQMTPLYNQLVSFSTQMKSLYDHMVVLNNQMENLDNKIGQIWESLGIVTDYDVTWDGEWEN